MPFGKSEKKKKEEDSDEDLDRELDAKLVRKNILVLLVGVINIYGSVHKTPCSSPTNHQPSTNIRIIYD